MRQTHLFGAAAFCVGDEQCNKWCLLSLVPSSLDHTIRNDDTVPYFMMLSIDMVMERRAWRALVKR
jgi:hypothetical protein